ncbi:CCA tRNA nucleotidyltransferase [uncultured Tateyamaria sp.]|uniref:CCA tRNA nucleotidyltransferase n=1 Tax=uncultured Tateyamaria sp. TaxID=455651 RepID=UPI002631178D|nr:CCA tRNA nucleotidyltransferase [uncultured Tateyamaria sp.]
MDRPTAPTLDPQTPFLRDGAAQALCQTLEDGGHRALFVGGCVRNAVMGLPASDLDISTDALPDRVVALATAAGFRAVPTGIDHGTITVVVDDTPLEVTTFRRDVATDGRRAVVAFSKDVKEDALRRDFTMNALYADRYGAITDPLGGMPDALARYVRFIEDAGARIREDYLRTLRYFRFHATYADPQMGWDTDALDGIASNLDGLETLSAERVGSEVLKLLSVPDPSPAVAVMDQTGVLARILPGAVPDLLAPVVHLEGLVQTAPDPLLRLAAIGGVDVSDRLRLSRKDSRTFDSIREHCASPLGAQSLGHIAGKQAGLGAALLRSAMANQPLNAEDVVAVVQGADTPFPISAKDLPDLSGPVLGERLQALKADWLASNLTKSKNDLLAP